MVSKIYLTLSMSLVVSVHCIVHNVPGTVNCDIQFYCTNLLGYPE